MEGRKERGGGWREKRREQRRETQRRRGKARGACNQIVQCHRMQRLGCGGDLVVCWKTQSLFQPPRLKTAAAKILTPPSDSSVDKEHTPSHTVHGYLRTCRQYLRTIKVLYMATSDVPSVHTPSHTVHGYLRTHTITYCTWLPQNVPSVPEGYQSTCSEPPARLRRESHCLAVGRGEIDTVQSLSSKTSFSSTPQKDSDSKSPQHLPKVCQVGHSTDRRIIAQSPSLPYLAHSQFLLLSPSSISPPSLSH